MEFDLSEEQRILADSIKRYCADQIPLEKVRASIIEEQNGADIWPGLVKLGLSGITVPEQAGGSEMTLLDAAIISEVLGYYAVPEHFFNATIAGLALSKSDQDQQGRLEQLAAGELIVGIGLTELVGVRENAGLTLANGYASGKALFVKDAGIAQAMLLGTTAGDIVWVDEVEKVQKRTLTTIDHTRQYAEIVCEQVPVTVLASSQQNFVQQLLAAARILIAADSLGAAQAMLDKAVAYSLERKQFNRVIGSFQAVKHMCSEMAASLEPCRALLWYAAHCHQATPDELALEACHLKAHLGEVTRFVARTATEVHGGVGFTDLMGLHYWFKRIGFDRQCLGGPEIVREEAAQLSGYLD